MNTVKEAFQHPEALAAVRDVDNRPYVSQVGWEERGRGRYVGDSSLRAPPARPGQHDDELKLKWT